MTELSVLARPLAKILPKNAVPKLSAAGVTTVADLLWFAPRRYLSGRSDLGDLILGDYVVFVGTVATATTRRMKSRRGTMLNVTVRSGPHDMDLTFFSAWGHEGKLTPGAVALFSGRVSRYQNHWQLAHPDYEILPEPTQPAADAQAETNSTPDWGLIPVYREVGGLPSWTISRCVQQVLQTYPDLPDPVPTSLRERRRLPELNAALRGLHRPDRPSDHREALRRLKYDEALVLQLILAQRRRSQQVASAIRRVEHGGGLREAFDARLPFTLTQGQRQVSAEIAADLAAGHPMHRLLQGEVGSGKTIVALRAMLTVIDAGGQAALLAPTEVLATQHHRTLSGLLGDLALGGMLGAAEHATRIALLTGSQSASARQVALAEVRDGSAGIVVGTHALLQEGVDFHDLALVVVDEQHRFGVAQRDLLRAKARTPAHVLVMTATPIPRTVAMTVFGDMDTSVLRELPHGRAPIVSHVVDNPRWYARMWQRVSEEVAAGRQVYVVCPRIGDDQQGLDQGQGMSEVADDELAADDVLGADDELVADRGGADVADERSGPVPMESSEPGQPPMRGVLETLEEVRAQPELAGARVEMLHGRLPAEAKDAVMRAFAAGQIDVLVATTVVEVGLDVPNATVMVILDADRFGVSQLHQLRGRVGRGSAGGLCLLVSSSQAEGTLERLRQVAATTDGFALSEFDLTYRKEGDILGAAQSGSTSHLRLLKLTDDGELIAQARADAGELISADPELAEHPLLAHAVATRLDDEQAAYLERG